MKHLNKLSENKEPATLFEEYSFGFGKEYIAKIDCSPEDGVQLIVTDDTGKKTIFKDWIHRHSCCNFAKAFQKAVEFYDLNNNIKQNVE